MAHGKIVDQIARLEIIRAIQDAIYAFQQFLNIGRIQVGDDASNLDGGIHPAQAPFSSRGLG